jgi:replicative DNA helicase
MAQQVRRTDGRQFERKEGGESILDRPLPYDLEAERGVLGAMLLLPDVCDDVALIVRPDDFYDDANRRIFEHMLAIHNDGRTIDPLLLMDRLKSAGVYDQIGGAATLAEMGKAVPRIANAVHYAQIVQQKSSNRSLIHAAAEILQESYDDNYSPSDLLNRAEQKIFQILDKQGQSNVTNIGNVLHLAMERIDARLRGEHTASGVETGLRDFDHLTGGLHNGELVILAARPSMGKTALALNMAEHAALKLRVPTLVVSLEMAALELGERILCSSARVNGHGLRNGILKKEDRLRLVEAAGLVSEAPLYIDDSPSRTVTEVAAAARRIKRRDGLGLVVIDYLQLLQPDNESDPRQEQVAKIARRLKGLARELQVPLLVLAQLNRQADAGRETPKLSHLRESGAIEQDADVVMFVHREDYGLTGEEAQNQIDGPNAKIIVAKQRNGPTGECRLQWVKQYTRFENPDSQPANEALAAFNRGGGDVIDG